MVDPQGRVLSQVSAFGTEEPTVVATIATQGMHTPYAQFGDVFAYLCLVGLGLLAALAISPKRQHNTLTPRVDEEPAQPSLASK
jgi:apolipoprotein N-acyltransferase